MLSLPMRSAWSTQISVRSTVTLLSAISPKAFPIKSQQPERLRQHALSLPLKSLPTLSSFTFHSQANRCNIFVYTFVATPLCTTLTSLHSWCRCTLFVICYFTTSTPFNAVLNPTREPSVPTNLHSRFVTIDQTPNFKHYDSSLTLATKIPPSSMTLCDAFHQSFSHFAISLCVAKVLSTLSL